MTAATARKWTLIRADTPTADDLAKLAESVRMTRPTFLRLLVQEYGPRLAKRHERGERRAEG